MPIDIAEAEAGAPCVGSLERECVSRPDLTRQIPLQDIESLLQELGASWQSGPFVWQRRRGHRAAYNREIVLVPAEGEGHDESCAEPCRVLGKEISAYGMSFTHTDPLPHRLVSLVCELPSGVVARILTRLKWCRFTRHGVYESGGEFLRVVQERPTPRSSD